MAIDDGPFPVRALSSARTGEFDETTSRAIGGFGAFLGEETGAAVVSVKWRTRY